MKRLLYLFWLATLPVVATAQSEYWKKVSAPVTAHLLSVSFGSPQVGYISGTGGALLQTRDGGLSWQQLNYSGISLSPASPDIIHVNFISPGTGFVIAGNRHSPEFRGTVYKTADSGATWQEVIVGNVAASRSFFFDAANGFVIGSAFFSGQNIVKQVAGTWGREHSFAPGASSFLYGIDFRNSNTGIVGGDGGLVYRSFNGGLSWDTVRTGIDSTINSLRFLSDSTIIAGTDNDGGAILVSNDTGRTWDVDRSTLTFSYPDIKDIAVSMRDSFVAVGHAAFGPSGIILWNEGQFTNNHTTLEPLNAVAMRDTAVAFIVGDSGAIYTNRLAVLSAPGNYAAPAPSIYPIPAATLCFTEAGFRHRLRLYDALGRYVAGRPELSYRHALDVASLPAGLYFIESQGETGHLNIHRLVIQR